MRRAPFRAVRRLSRTKLSELAVQLFDSVPKLSVLFAELRDALVGQVKAALE